MSSSKDPLLEIDSLSRRFGAKEVVSDFSLRLPPGERTAICGPNGAGKTTILRCAAGTLLPSSGRVRVGGYNAGSMRARRLVGASLAQERSFYLRLTGRANLVLFATFRHDSRRAAAREVAALEEELELREIAAERVDRCSTGMVQQLAFARALLGQPSALLLDEPTRSLDKAAVERLWSAVERRERLAVLVATHLDQDIARCGERIDLVV